MKKMSLCLAGIATFASIFINAEESKNLVVNGNASDGLKNWAGIQKVADGGPDGAKYFEVTGHSYVISREAIPVDTSSEYQLSGWFKSGNEKENKAYVGLAMLDEKKRPISAETVTPLLQSDTVLSAESKKGENVVKVKDASKWEQLLGKKQLSIAFDVDDSGEYKDLPNFKCYSVTQLEKKEGFWEVILNAPLSADFGMETKVRAHYTGGHYMYVLLPNGRIADWTKFSGIVNPMVKSGSPKSTFWPGTKYVRILILANWGQKGGETLLFSNISLEKVEPKK